MLKIIVELNESKIDKEKRYSVEKLYKSIDSVFERFGLVKSDKGVFVGSGLDTDFANFSNTIYWLKDEEWFKENVEKWLWYNSDNADGIDENGIEDLILEFLLNEV